MNRLVRIKYGCRFTFISILICGFVAVVNADDEHLAIVGDDNAKPKNWLSDDGRPQGIMIDLLEEVSRRTGIQFTYQLVPWKRAYVISEKGQAAIIGFSKTAKREENWYYSEPMYFDPLVIVTTRNSQFEFSGLSSLKGKRLAIKLGTSYGDDFEHAREQNLFVVVETTDRAGQLRMLTLDRVDAVLVSPGQIALDTTIMENDWLKGHRNSFVVLDPPYKLDPNFLGVPKSMNKSHLLPAFNKALESMRHDGTYQIIVDRNTAKVLKQLAAAMAQ